MQTFTIDGKPFGKQRPRVTTKGAFAHAYTPKETAEYEELVRTAYKTQCVGKFPKDIPLSLTIVAVFEPPKSDSKKKREDKLNCVVRPTIKPDWDNIGKVICDALNGVAWEDDSRIVSASVSKVYGEKAKVAVMISDVKGEVH